MPLLDTKRIRAHLSKKSKKATPAAKKAPKAKEKVVVEEDHPIGPVVHAGTRVILFGTFPPVRRQIHFYYPNPQNDMWKILGQLFFRNGDYFYVPQQTKRTLNEAAILHFAASHPVGFADIAQRVRRVAGNSSDDNIEVLRRVDVLRDVLAAAPDCQALISTGTMALEGLLEALSEAGQFEDAEGHRVQVRRVGRGGKVRVVVPPVGKGYLWRPDAQGTGVRPLHVYRAPSTSRALPMPLMVKEDYYRTFFASHLHLA